MPRQRGLPPEVQARRVASVPPLSYPEELPVSARREEIRRAIELHQVVIVCGETGSGKTTQLPKICLAAGRGRTGYIGHTQPRRIAARTVAARIAAEMNTPLGQLVGYKVRFQDHTRPESLVKLMTDGILLAETQADRFLNRYDTLIVDEAHERSLNIDFLLGYLSWLLPRRPDFRLVITSATIDPERFSRHFNGAPIINVSGRSYPVEVRYRAVDVEEGDETEGDEQEAIAAAVEELWRDQDGDILVFLSGEREIRETAETLRKRHPEHCEILPLYSRLSQAEQERVFRPSGRRRVVLATNVAETSLTVPGIRAVIDTGRARISRYSHRSRLQRLPIEKISRASASQRSGRCGRVGPGIAIRLYSEEDFLSRPEFTEPEIHRTNLAAVILQMHALRLGDIERFPFVEPPDGRYVRDGLRTLQELGALDETHRLTPVGQQLAKLPVDPRLGRMLIAAASERSLAEVAVIVAALGVPDPRDRPPDKQTQADQKHAQFRDEKSDFLSLLKLWIAYEAQRKQLSRAKLRAWCKENFLSYLRMIEWHDIHGQIMEVLKGELALKLNEQPADYIAIHRALLAGLLTLVCERHEQAEYLGTRGQKVFIHPGSGQFKARPPWMVCAEQVETTRVYARNVARIEPEWVEQVGAHLVRLQHYEPHWERKQARVVVFERSTLFGLTLQAGRKVNYDRIAPAEARALFIRHALVLMEYDSKAPFLGHNRHLLEETDYLQQKERRVDLLADENQLFAFFDAKLPPQVTGTVSFERWRKDAERTDPRILYLGEQDIAGDAGAGIDPWKFPDHLQAGPLRVELEYRFEPGHAEDGVTALVPLHILPQLKPEPFQWLVPGLLEEKVAALIRVLPKDLRVNFVPVPDHAARALDQLDAARGDGLHAQLAAALFRRSGVRVGADSFREELLPVHLRMHYALLDENRRVIDRGRDLAQLQRRHGGEAVQNFQQLAGQALLKTGCRTWEFGDVPESFNGMHDGQKLFGYPALVDEGESVGLRLFPLPEQAQACHRLGLMRLLRLVLAREIKPLRRDLAVNVQAELAYRTLSAHAWLRKDVATGRELRDDLLDLLVAARFLEGKPLPRTAADFDAMVGAGKSGLALLAQELSRSAQQALEGWAAVQSKLKALRMPALAADVGTQLGYLMPAGYLLVTPWQRLREYPRYLKALLQRVEKAGQDAGRDQKLAAEAQQWETRYWQAVKAEKASRPPEEDAFRWLLEEFRVSLFAQKLGTAVPVSAKRLADAWQQRGASAVPGKRP